LLQNPIRGGQGPNLAVEPYDDDDDDDDDAQHILNTGHEYRNLEDIYKGNLTLNNNLCELSKSIFEVCRWWPLL
jgi:hypothetical protein